METKINKNKTKTEMLSELMEVQHRIGGYNGLGYLKSRSVAEVKECYNGAIELGIIKSQMEEGK